ncbi:YjdF family protein [Hungatella hathewayi]|uniref:YjdF family protein n=1 Tax=Hungatella hathewayi TaxID=154046 RepID=UPI00356B5C48
MDKVSLTFRVFFEDPFWIGVVERISDGTMEVCKITFGMEPKEYEVYDWLLKNYYRLRFSPAVKAEAKKEHSNPKRRQREARMQTAVSGIGTKSQQALSLQHEHLKAERKIRTREQKEAEKEARFELKQQKRKEKHRGR